MWSELVEMAVLASESIRRFGVEPKVAFIALEFRYDRLALGAEDAASRTVASTPSPELEVEGEMHSNSAINERTRELRFLRTSWKEARTC